MCVKELKIMKEGAFIHIDPKTPWHRKDRLQTIFSSETPITQKEISRYVDDVVYEIKRVSDPEQRQTIFLEMLSPDAFIVRYFYLRLPLLQRMLATVVDTAGEDLPEMDQFTKEDFDVMRAEIRRVRGAIMEELKKRLIHDVELQHINYSDIHFFDSVPLPGNENLKKYLNLYGERLFLKKEKELLDATKKSSSGFESPTGTGYHLSAMRTLAALAPNDHVLSPIRFDVIQQKTLAHDLNWENEGISHDSKLVGSDRKSSLQIIRDCMLGAQFLERNDLVLQDICPSNIGFCIKRGQRVGILFDLEGLCPKGALLKTRLYQAGFLPPEFEFGHPAISVQPSEMVFQFGRCLEKIVLSGTTDEGSRTLLDELEKLAQDMTAYDEEANNPTANRIDLAEALRRIEAILRRFSSSETEK